MLNKKYKLLYKYSKILLFIVAKTSSNGGYRDTMLKSIVSTFFKNIVKYGVAEIQYFLIYTAYCTLSPVKTGATEIQYSFD